MGSTQKKKKTVQQRRRDTIGQHEKVTTKRKSAASQTHIAKHAAEPVRTSGSKKRRRMNWKEWIAAIAAIVIGLVLCLIMFVNMKIFPYEIKGEDGTAYTVRISLIQKIRNWTPFVDLDGELNSKEYSYAVKSEAQIDSNTTESAFDDGLDLDQIQEGQFSVLFLGLDELRANTDVMMLVMFDIAANKINILQIPRDTFVPDHTSFEGAKLNSVYTMGNTDVSAVQRVVDCVEETFHVPIDRYVTTGCSDIVKIVDLIGGVPINMPYTIYYEPGKTIYAGEQVLNGQQAEWMVRYRHGYNEGDIGRMQAQRIFLAAAMEKVCDIGTLELMLYMDTIVDEQLIGSNLSMDEISKLSDFAITVGMENISMFMLPGEGYDYYPENWKHYRYYSVWSIHYGPTVNLLNKYFRPYYEPIYDLPIKELITEGHYLNTMYDNESTDFEDLVNGNTFNGH